MFTIKSIINVCQNNILKITALIYYFLLNLFNNNINNKNSMLYNSYREKSYQRTWQFFKKERQTFFSLL